MFTTIAVLGAGTMGKSIAKLFVQNNLAVRLYDTNVETLEKAKHEFFRDKDFNKHITFETELNQAVQEADLIIESVFEDLETKRSLYKQLTGYVKEDTVICSNTSSYSLASLTLEQPLQHQMLIAHFFNPADIVPLVEIVQSENTKQGICDQIVTFLKTCGKVPVVLHKDCKGFIANRLQAAVLREACSLVEKGVADAIDVDKVMVEGIGFRWAFEGPFSITDQGGLDIWKKVCENLLPDLCDNKEVPVLLTDKIANNELGIKSGIGFYQYSAFSKQTFLQAREKYFQDLCQIRFGHSFI